MKKISLIPEKADSVKYPQHKKNVLNIKACQYHVLIKPSKPCIDCFIRNYYGSEIFLDPECAKSVIRFKESLDSSFGK